MSEVQKTTRKAKRVETYGTYILKVLKSIETEEGKSPKDIGVSKRCMASTQETVCLQLRRQMSGTGTLFGFIPGQTLAGKAPKVALMRALYSRGDLDNGEKLTSNN